MSDKIINLSEFFKASSLIARQAARELFDIISKTSEQKIILDFRDINFASRSFFDEFNSKSSQFKLLGKEIAFINVNENIEKIKNLVENASKSRSSISYASVNNAEIIAI